MMKGSVLLRLLFCISALYVLACEFKVFSYSSVYGGVHKRAVSLRPFFCEPTALRSENCEL